MKRSFRARAAEVSLLGIAPPAADACDPVSCGRVFGRFDRHLFAFGDSG